MVCEAKDWVSLAKYWTKLDKTERLIKEHSRSANKIKLV